MHDLNLVLVERCPGRDDHTGAESRCVGSSHPANDQKSRSPLVWAKVASGMDDTLTAIAIRAAVFSGERGIPIDKVFDGNDFCSTHIISYMEDTPVGSLRVRCFREFARIERVCVLKKYRSLTVINALTNAFFQYCASKGYQTVTGSVRPDTMALWRRHGARISGPVHQTVAGEMQPMIGDLPLAPDGPLLEDAGSPAFEEAMAAFEGDCLTCY